MHLILPVCWLNCQLDIEHHQELLTILRVDLHLHLSFLKDEQAILRVRRLSRVQLVKPPVPLPGLTQVMVQCLLQGPPFECSFLLIEFAFHLILLQQLFSLIHRSFHQLKFILLRFEDSNRRFVLRVCRLVLISLQYHHLSTYLLRFASSPLLLLLFLQLFSQRILSLR